MAIARSGGRFFVPGKDGAPANGWKVETHAPGSAGVLGTNDKAVYTDYTLTTPLANPFVLDERGEKEVWFKGQYLIKVRDELNNLIYTFDYYGTGDSNLDYDSVAKLILTAGEYNGQIAYLKGYYTTGDGGGGPLYWDATSTETPDNGMIFQVTGVTTGRWKRPDVDIIDARLYGARLDGSDDSDFIQSGLDYHGKVIISGEAFIAKNLELNSHNLLAGRGINDRIYCAENSNINLVKTKIISNVSGEYNENITIKNIQLDHNRTIDFTAETLMTLLLIGARDVFIDNVWFRRPNTDCIYISDTYGGTGHVDNIPKNINISKSKFTGNYNNRNGISLIACDGFNFDKLTFDKMSRSDMPGAIDLEPNTAAQFVKNGNIDNINLYNCKQGLVTYFSDATNNLQINNINISNINVDGTPVQDGTYSEFTASNSTQGVGIVRASDINLSNINVKSANSNSFIIEESENINAVGVHIKDAKTHGIVVRDSINCNIDDFSVDCSNATFNSVATKGVFLRYLTTGAGHIGVRDSVISNGVIGLTDATVATTYGFAGEGNIIDIVGKGIKFNGNWTSATIQSSGSTGIPDKWTMQYSIEDGSSMEVASFFGQGANNGIWEVPGYTSGIATFATSGVKALSSRFAISSTSIIQVTRITAGTGVVGGSRTGVNVWTLTSSDASETGDVLWKIIRP